MQDLLGILANPKIFGVILLVYLFVRFLGVTFKVFRSILGALVVLSLILVIAHYYGLF